MQRVAYILILLLLASPCWGAAPTVVLDIPTVTATRMSPCPVHAGINIASSSTGDSSTWDQCRIMWQLEADGSALTNWPSKYRYCTDPRPGLNSKQIDLAGQTDTDNFNRPRGFNFGWVLTEGTWRIKCTVTNPEGSSTTTTSSDITIAADSRTEFTVQASGGDDTSLASLLASDPGTTGTIIAQRDGITITIEDGHAENVTAALTTITGDNFVIRQAGTGTRPVLTYSDAADTGFVTMLTMDGEHGVIEGIAMAESTGNIGAGNDGTLSLGGIVHTGTQGAVVNCNSLSDDTTYWIKTAYGPSVGSNGFLVLNCETETTKSYSCIPDRADKTTVVGCTFGRSESESVCRTIGDTDQANFLWSLCRNDTLKSSIRLWSCTHGHIYGCYMSDGDNTLGDNTGNPLTCTTARIEANYIDGSAAQTLLAGGLEDDISNISAFNNITSTSDADGAYKVRGTNCAMSHNTLCCLDGYDSSQVKAFDATATNKVNCNLFLHDDKADVPSSTSYCVDVASTIGELNYNTFFDKAGIFARFDVTADYENSAADMNTNRAFATGNEEKDVTLDSSYVPDSPTTVTTQAGVYDDFFGTARSSTSWAGAVGSEPASESQGIFQTFIPGLIAQPAP